MNNIVNALLNFTSLILVKQRKGNLSFLFTLIMTWTMISRTLYPTQTCCPGETKIRNLPHYNLHRFLLSSSSYLKGKNKFRCLAVELDLCLISNMKMISRKRQYTDRFPFIINLFYWRLMAVKYLLTSWFKYLVFATLLLLSWS